MVALQSNLGLLYSHIPSLDASYQLIQHSTTFSNIKIQLITPRDTQKTLLKNHKIKLENRKLIITLTDSKQIS